MKNKPNEAEPQQQKSDCIKALRELPRPLQKTVLQRFGIALLVAVLGTAMLLLTKDVMYCMFYVLAILPSASAFDILWKYQDQKIMVARLIVCKAKRKRKVGQIDAILRDATVREIPDEEVVETYRLRIPVGLSDYWSNITPGTVLDVYISASAPETVLTYEILGELSGK